jgi:NADH-quinone oxidoreductase subunit L
MLGLILLFPLIGVLINGLFGKKLSDRFVSGIACGSIGASFAVVAWQFFVLLSRTPDNRLIYQRLFIWMQSGTFTVPFALQFDQLSAVMALIVSGVSFIIHIYSVGYMHGDRGYARYFTYLNLFVLMMLTLVLADSYLVMFIGWEGVGLCSYLLIGFWYEDDEKATAGRKAFIVNRIGDFGFLIGMFLLFKRFGSLEYSSVFKQVEGIQMLNDPTIVAITLLLFIGAVGKSAQIPLYVWLPDAMAGPTPVSALIHAATMVTAGVYMVARSNLLYALAPISMVVVAGVGVFTALYAATIGIAQQDIKKVLAYSTISQLGYMFLAVGVGAFSAGIFHLMTHAFFKALLFLGAGSVIHSLSGEQNMLNMGGLRKHLPITFPCLFIAALTISGMPLLSGFFSKDEILWYAYASPLGNLVLWIIGTVGAGITAFYMFRLVFLTFFGASRVKSEAAAHIHESPRVMTIPLIILAVLSVIGGYIGVPGSLGGKNHFEHFLSPVFEKANTVINASGEAVHDSIEYILIAAAFGIALAGFVLAYRMYIAAPDAPKRVAEKLGNVYRIVANKYYVDELYDEIIVKPFYWVSDMFWKLFDIRIIDGAVNGTAAVFRGMGQGLRRIQTGYVQEYIVMFLIGVISIFAVLLFR